VPLDVDPTPVRGVWFRHVPAGGEPFFRPERPEDGRWQRGDVVEGFYLADSEETAWAEWYRALAERGVPPMSQLPRDLWRFDVDVAHVADLTSDERLERVGLLPPVPDRRQWPAFQAVGETVFTEGWVRILYPAAARSESLAQCLFRVAAELPGVRTRRPPARYEESPVPPRRLRA
jgi:RES domain-containing protein